METFDANEMELQRVMHLDFDQWGLSQQQPTMNNDGSCSSNLTSPTHQDFSQPLESMDVSSTFMLPTPGGSESNGGTDLIVSPYDMMATASGNVFREEVYQDDGGYLFELEPGVLTETPQANAYSNPYMTNGLISPLTSPNLPPDIATSQTTMRQQRNVNKSSSRNMAYPSNSVRNNNRYTPLTKQKSASTNSATSRQKKQQNQLSQEDYNITITSDMVLPTTTSPIINSSASSSLIPSPQDTMPNLNLGDNLVSTIHSTQFTSAPQPSITIPSTNNQSPNKISPIAPASLLMLKKPSTSLQKQSKPQKDQDQSQSRKVAAADKQHQMFMSPSSNGRTVVMATGQPQMIVISPMTPIALGPASSSNGVGMNSRKTNRQNTNSPTALGPSTNSKSPQGLKPTISPNLKPKLPGVLANEVAEQLAQKSNYQTILEGTAESLGISYPSDLQSSLESRRTTHKAAEQKRRDSLKQSFDELKKVLNGNDNNSASSNRETSGKNDGTIKNASKLFLLNKAHDHIVELEKKNKVKDELIERLKKEIESLKEKHSECEKGAEGGRPQETPMAIDDAEK